jgi:hypothetical protein
MEANSIGLKLVNILLLLSFLEIGCGNTQSVQTVVSLSDTECQSNSAQMLVGDGLLKVTCGCVGSGESGKVYALPSNVTCHLSSSSSQVFFYLWGAQTSHQIVPTGTHQFQSTPVLNSKLNSMPSSSAITFPSAGVSYEFKEVYTGFQGQFIVP